jgi:hypothetical protein
LRSNALIVNPGSAGAAEMRLQNLYSFPMLSLGVFHDFSMSHTEALPFWKTAPGRSQMGRDGFERGRSRYLELTTVSLQNAKDYREKYLFGHF